jgi:hypothetical protein
MSLHEDDFYAWCVQQAAALRSVPADAPFDVATVADEIEALGQRRLEDVEAHLTGAFDRITLLALQPDHPDRAKWRALARNHQDDLLEPLTPSMPVDIAECWRIGRANALSLLAEAKLTGSVAKLCPFDLRYMTNEEFDLNAAVERAVAVSSKMR